MSRERMLPCVYGVASRVRRCVRALAAPGGPIDRTGRPPRGGQRRAAARNGARLDARQSRRGRRRASWLTAARTARNDRGPGGGSRERSGRRRSRPRVERRGRLCLQSPLLRRAQYLRVVSPRTPAVFLHLPATPEQTPPGARRRLSRQRTRSGRSKPPRALSSDRDGRSTGTRTSLPVIVRLPKFESVHP